MIKKIEYDTFIWFLVRASFAEVTANILIQKANIDAWISIIIGIIIGFIPFIVGILFAIRIEQIAGYYECQKCHHKYIPTYSNVLWSMHVNRTRYMRCPKCNQKSWQKKIINK